MASTHYLQLINKLSSLSRVSKFPHKGSYQIASQSEVHTCFIDQQFEISTENHQVVDSYPVM